MGYSYQKIIESDTTPTLEDGNLWVKDGIVYVPNTTLSAWVEQSPSSFLSIATSLAATGAALDVEALPGTHTSLVVQNLTILGEVGTAHSDSLFYTGTVQYSVDGAASTALSTVAGVSVDTKLWTTVDVMSRSVDSGEALISTVSPISRLLITMTKTSTAANISSFLCGLDVKRAIVVA